MGAVWNQEVAQMVFGAREMLLTTEERNAIVLTSENLLVQSCTASAASLFKQLA